MNSKELKKDYPNIRTIEDSLDSLKQRFEELQELYYQKFNKDPDFFIRCPGRVNIIGEHIDYSGFAVLPAAIEKDILCAVGYNPDDNLNIYNFDCSYSGLTIPVDMVNVDHKNRHWYDYIICSLIELTATHTLKNKAFNFIVKGNIPPGAGLSSSSALVCAGALAIAFANRLQINKESIASLCARGERRIGTQGGGMDQAIIFMAEEGYAKKISFNPLTDTSVRLPIELQFIVAHSGATMNKADSHHFNKRVSECTLAAKVLAKKTGISWTNISTLSQLKSALKKTIVEMADLARDLLKLKPYKRNEICSVLSINEEDLKKILQNFGDNNSTYFQEFALGMRAVHVFTEAFNVESFITSCQTKTYEDIGLLFKKSHESCKQNFECSHPKLDELVQVAVDSGALGARLTGAGWGGCVIAAVKSDKVEQVFAKMQGFAIENNVQDFIFLTKPSEGASIYV